MPFSSRFCLASDASAFNALKSALHRYNSKGEAFDHKVNYRRCRHHSSLANQAVSSCSSLRGPGFSRLCGFFSPLSTVYRGVFEDVVVAVKVTESSTEKQIKSAEAESAISLDLDHPNLVKVAVRPILPFPSAPEPRGKNTAANAFVPLLFGAQQQLLNIYMRRPHPRLPVDYQGHKLEERHPNGLRRREYQEARGMRDVDAPGVLRQGDSHRRR